MSFTSFEFMLFAGAVLVLYYVIPNKFKKSLQWKLLLIASVFFYYMTGLTNLLYMSATIVTTYLAALMINRLINAQEKLVKDNVKQGISPKDGLCSSGGRILPLNKAKQNLTKEELKAYKAKNKKKRFCILTLCLLINFGLLGIVKVTGLAILGVSFYVFRSMSYIIDINRGKFPCQRNPFKLALFISFFPLIMQGPITRYDETEPALFAGNKFVVKKTAFGLQRVLWGVFKKLVIADRLGVAVVTLCNNPEQYGGVYALMAMCFYAVTLYADFSGGIDITIGIGEALGIPIAENFKSPFLSRNIFEYWRRWHITMGRWFREYLFYPLSVCKPMLKLSGFTRKRFGNVGKRIPVYIVTTVTWFSTGIWHGVSPNFIVWGLLNGVVIMISQELEPLYLRFNKFTFTKSFPYTCFRIFRTFWLMCFIRSYDCYAGVRTTVSVHLSIITDFQLGKLLSDGVSELGLNISDYIVVGCGLAVLITACFIKHKTKCEHVRHWLSEKTMPLRFLVYGALLFGVIIFGVYGFGFDARGFLYTQF
ncbi:MAG: MBOAT family protein [Oscillospiraceae bacterium]|nr:MBOAT family protein [Oscillospiraceae bacterium]